ncbi:MAG: ABC transporter ATP-binding protein [Epsilonproteobacteria bacterium]|nr:MAG: ABC transporter ATP-binding protein [Campylobacterota bacterium]RLA63757.1 MAG: ABC transporter ATP-binding protein [Campylobacterota bacterium]
MIQVNNLNKSYGAQSIFKDLSFNLSKGDKVGLVGRNGTGKSTLIKIICGAESADSGEVKIPKNYKIGKLDQHISFSKDTVMQECIQSLPVDEQYDEYKVEKILMGLGMTVEDMDKEPKTFSGGYQIRIQLAKVLLGKPDLLLLDEPTNYLDILSLRWLEKFLISYPGEVIIITHDRIFMDQVCTHVMGINYQMLKKVKGKTQDYYHQMILEAEIIQKTIANQDKKQKELQAFVDRFRAKASKAKQAQSRVKQLEKMDKVEALEGMGDLGFKFHFTPCPGKFIAKIEDLSMSFDQKRWLFKDLNFSIEKNDRIGIIGKNGQGKSTLLNIIAGELKPITGEISFHPSVKKGHFGQTNILRLHQKNTIEQEIAECNDDMSYKEVRSICGSMMFEGDAAKKQISVLSGGEKSRVLLGKILAHPANLLLLDEPTNHLDIESIESLTEELTNFKGAVVLVTHSELLLKNVVNKLIVFNKEGAFFFDGGYDRFLEKIGWEEEAGGKKKIKPKLSKKESKRLRAEYNQEKSQLLGPLKKRLEQVELLICQKEEEVESLNKSLIEASNTSDGEKISKCSKELKETEDLIEKLFEEMETLSLAISEKEEVIKIKFGDLDNE